MKKLNKKGFTLIELLIVIAIIGLLSTLAVVSLSSARAKARDAKRLSDVKQLSTALEIVETEAPNHAILMADDGLAAAVDNLAPLAADASSAPNADAVFSDLDWSNFADPNFSPPAGADTVCADATNAVCQYTFGVAAPTTANYEICFFTEEDSSVGVSDVYKVVEGGAITAGCST